MKEQGDGITGIEIHRITAKRGVDQGAVGGVKDAKTVIDLDAFVFGEDKTAIRVVVEGAVDDVFESKG